jgi:hypothetical protein
MELWENAAMEQQYLWVEPVGSIIVARLRGVLSAEMLQECQDRVLALARDTGQARVLYDSLEVIAPEIDLVLLQQRLEREKKASLGALPLRTAILVPNTRIAYLARLAFGQFGEEHYRVFYNDMGRALKWLEAPEPAGG